ncbi:hypothetical protein Taro_004839 [Colocasia esculenta]|uniref:Uncharacterized protein n=1 Tax=Colocasia esculenta TaxID=4460 RepID=A0A843TLC5_COLES|nr:hypothetical protein [Colocasia esculenta]
MLPPQVRLSAVTTYGSPLSPPPARRLAIAATATPTHCSHPLQLAALPVPPARRPAIAYLTIEISVVLGVIAHPSLFVIVSQAQDLRTRRPNRSHSQGRHDSTLCRDLIATGSVVAICLPDLTSPSRPSRDPVAICLPELTRLSHSVQDPIAISSDPVGTLIRVRKSDNDVTHTNGTGPV